MSGRPVPEQDECYQFHIDDLVFHISVAGGTTSVHRGPAGKAAMTAHADSRTFVSIGGGLLTPFEAVAAGRLSLAGDPEAVLRCSKLLGLL